MFLAGAARVVGHNAGRGTICGAGACGGPGTGKRPAILRNGEAVDLRGDAGLDLLAR